MVFTKGYMLFYERRLSYYRVKQLLGEKHLNLFTSFGPGKIVRLHHR